MDANTLTTEEAARLLGTTTATVRQSIRRGALAATRHGRDWFVARAEVERYAREKRTWTGTRPQEWPRTPTMRRLVRPQIAAQIAARGLNDAEARAANIAAGWTVTTPGGPVSGYRWTRGEWAVLAPLVEEARTARLPGDDVPF